MTERHRVTRKAMAIVAACMFAALVAGIGAFAAAQLTTESIAVEPAATAVRAMPSSTPREGASSTATPTSSASALPGEGAGGDSGSAGGTSGDSTSGSGGSSGGSGGGIVPPPPPPPPPAEPPYTDADARAAVVNRWGAVPVYGLCTASNYGTFGNHSSPPAPVFVGILGYEAGANDGGTGGWVKYYSCE